MDVPTKESYEKRKERLISSRLYPFVVSENTQELSKIYEGQTSDCSQEEKETRVTILRYSLAIGMFKTFNFFLEKKLIPDDILKGQPGLFFLCLKKSLYDFARLWIHFDRDIFSDDHPCSLCVHYAIACGDLDLLEFLLQNGANPNVFNNTSAYKGPNYPLEFLSRDNPHYLNVRFDGQMIHGTASTELFILALLRHGAQYTDKMPTGVLQDHIYKMEFIFSPYKNAFFREIFNQCDRFQDTLFRIHGDHMTIPLLCVYVLCDVGAKNAFAKIKEMKKCEVHLRDEHKVLSLTEFLLHLVSKRQYLDSCFFREIFCLFFKHTCSYLMHPKFFEDLVMVIGNSSAMICIARNRMYDERVVKMIYSKNIESGRSSRRNILLDAEHKSGCVNRFVYFGMDCSYLIDAQEETCDWITIQDCVYALVFDENSTNGLDFKKMVHERISWGADVLEFFTWPRLENHKKTLLEKLVGVFLKDRFLSIRTYELYRGADRQRPLTLHDIACRINVDYATQVAESIEV